MLYHRAMLRLDRSRLEGARFAEVIAVPTRMDDLDVQGHVNNVALAVILQEGRADFNRKRMGEHFAAGGGLVVGSLFIDYAGQMFHPDPIEVSTGVLEIGRSSFVLGQVARQNGRITAYAEAALVATSGAGTMPLSVSARASLEAAMIRR